MTAPLRINVVAPDRLSRRQISVWHQLLRTEFGAPSPFLTPEFVRLVSRVRGDVEVGVVSRDGEPVGFFPFQWKSETLAGPVGGRLSDLQAVIAARDLDWSPEQLLDGCDLVCWNFDHLISSQAPWRPHHYAVEPSPYLDLSQGFDAYREERRRAGSDKVRQILRKRRQLEREHGPLRFDPACTDEAILDLLLDWKSGQYLRTGQHDLFAETWPRRILAGLFDERSPSLAPLMAVLYAGPRPVAIDLGMRSFGTFHSWFTSYDPAFARHSPGHVLTMTVAEHASSLGIERFELGKGPEEYKRSIASAAFSVAEGAADLRPVPARFRRGWHQTQRWIKRSPLGPSARSAARLARTLGRTLASA